MLCARESSELIKASWLVLKICLIKEKRGKKKLNILEYNHIFIYSLSNLAEIVQHSANNLCPLLFDLVLCCTTVGTLSLFLLLLLLYFIDLILALFVVLHCYMFTRSVMVNRGLLYEGLQFFLD